MKRLVSVLSLGLVLGACGGGAPAEPPEPPPFDPTGDYSVTIEAQGMSIGGSMTISGAEDAYSGSIDTEMGGAAMSDVVLTGNEMTFSLPDVGVSFRITFEGDEFTGEFDGAVGAGTIYGIREGGV